MAAKDYQLVLAAAAKRLSDVYANPTVGGPDDIPYRQILVTVETGPAFLGSTSTVSSTKYGITVVATNDPVPIGGFDTGPMKLSDFWVAGTGTLHILGIPF